MDEGAPPLAIDDSDYEEEEVQSVQSKRLNDDGNHEMKNSHKGIYTPKGLQIELNRKPAAVFLKYFDAKIVTVKGHAGFGACGLHCKAPGCSSILKKRVATEDVVMGSI